MNATHSGGCDEEFEESRGRGLGEDSRARNQGLDHKLAFYAEAPMQSLL